MTATTFSLPDNETKINSFCTSPQITEKFFIEFCNNAAERKRKICKKEKAEKIGLTVFIIWVIAVRRMPLLANYCYRKIEDIRAKFLGVLLEFQQGGDIQWFFTEVRINIFIEYSFWNIFSMINVYRNVLAILNRLFLMHFSSKIYF